MQVTKTTLAMISHLDEDGAMLVKGRDGYATRGVRK